MLGAYQTRELSCDVRLGQYELENSHYIEYAKIKLRQKISEEFERLCTEADRKGETYNIFLSRPTFHEEPYIYGRYETETGLKITIKALVLLSSN